MTEETSPTEYPTNRDVIARAKVMRDLARQGSSQEYKSAIAGQYAQYAQNLAMKIDELERADRRLPQIRLRNLKRMAENHARRAEGLETRTDSENRVRISHRYDEGRVLSGVDLTCAQDPVYQTLNKLSRSIRDEKFTELMRKKKLTYALNSRKNPSVKRHRQLFSNTLWQALVRLEDRKMNEQEYTMIQNDPEGYLMKTYVETRDALNEHMTRVEDLRKKYASGQPMTNQEKMALMFSVMQI